MTQWQGLVRKPEVALDLKTGWVHEPVRGVWNEVIRSELSDFRPKQRR